jgi:hypothetical protein
VLYSATCCPLFRSTRSKPGMGIPSRPCSARRQRSPHAGGAQSEPARRRGPRRGNAAEARQCHRGRAVARTAGTLRLRRSHCFPWQRRAYPHPPILR